jgi:hypothetical protein
VQNPVEKRAPYLKMRLDHNPCLLASLFADLKPEHVCEQIVERLARVVACLFFTNSSHVLWLYDGEKEYIAAVHFNQHGFYHPNPESCHYTEGETDIASVHCTNHQLCH